MESREFLEQIGNLEHKIWCMKLRYDEYNRLSLSIPTQDFTKPVVDKSHSNEAPFVKWINKMVDLEKQINEKEKELELLKQDVLLSIEELENEDHKTLLTLRYLKKMTYSDIADKLFISISTFKRWHEEALSSIVVPQKYRSL